MAYLHTQMQTAGQTQVAATLEQRDTTRGGYENAVRLCLSTNLNLLRTGRVLVLRRWIRTAPGPSVPAHLPPPARC